MKTRSTFLSNSKKFSFLFVFALLATTTLFAQPANNDCASATPIACGDVVIDSTNTATSEPGLQFCGTTLNNAPGVWYSFVGNGETIIATTCGAATNYDTKIGVFSGTCDALVCVTGDDDEFSCAFSVLQSRVSFASTVGTTYYVYVTGFGRFSSGTFELSVLPPEGDGCPIPPPIPTMSQWGLLILGLTIVSLGVVGIYNLQKGNSTVA